MKKIILGIIITAFTNIISINAQPLKISSITIGNKKENKLSEMPPLKKKDFITKEQDINEGIRSEIKSEKEFNRIHKKEIRKIKRTEKKYKNNHGLTARRRKEQ